MSFTGSLLGAYLPSIPSTVTGTLRSSVLFGAGATTTGEVYPIATLGAVVFGVVLVAAPALRVGRNRLWYLRDENVANLSADLRRIMTERESEIGGGTERDGVRRTGEAIGASLLSLRAGDGSRFPGLMTPRRVAP